jgi:hypothetical protein
MIIRNISAGTHCSLLRTPQAKGSQLLMIGRILHLRGEPTRIIRAGEPFWEPGGDVIHYQAANNLPDKPSSFVVVILCVPGQPMLTLVSDEELRERADRRHPARQPTADSGPAR